VTGTGPRSMRSTDSTALERRVAGVGGGAPDGDLGGFGFGSTSLTFLVVLLGDKAWK
jgi:hypothetical protein